MSKKIKKLKNKPASQAEFGAKKDKAKEMYANAPVFKALMYVALPGILISFMQGLFIFADQLMMVNLIPKAGSPSLHSLFHAYYFNVKQFLNAWNFILQGYPKLQLSTFSIDALVRFTVSLITPGLYILNAITILIGMGTAVSFSKAIGARNRARAYDSWSTGVISTIVVSIVSSSIIIGIAYNWIIVSAGSSSLNNIEKTVTDDFHLFLKTSVKLSNGQSVSGLQLWNIMIGNTLVHNGGYQLMYPPIPGYSSKPFMIKPFEQISANNLSPFTFNPVSLKNIKAASNATILGQDVISNVYIPFYHLYHQKAIAWAVFYLRVDAAFNIFACFNQYFSLMIRSEGRQFFPAFLATAANALNITMDYFLIMDVHLGVYGSLTALVCGWAFNVILFLIYIGIMERRNDIVTYLKFNRVRFKYFKWDILWVAVGIGIGASIWNAGIAVQGTIQDLTLAQATIEAKLSVPPSYYVELNGAMLPIVNLAFTALYGTVQGGRALVSYSYGARRYDRVKQEYWLSLLVAIVYGIFVYIIIGIAINKYMLDGFNVTEGILSPIGQQTFFNHASFFLRISMLQILTYTFSMPCILLFQSIGKIGSAFISSSLKGFIFDVIAFYMMLAVAKAVEHQTGMDYFLASLPICSAMAGVVCFVWGGLYLHYRLGKPTKMQVNHLCRNLLKTDFSIVPTHASDKVKLLKALVIPTK